MSSKKKILAERIEELAALVRDQHLSPESALIAMRNETVLACIQICKEQRQPSTLNYNESTKYAQAIHGELI